MTLPNSSIPAESDNRYIFGTIEFPDGEMPSLPLLVFEMDTVFTLHLGPDAELNINVTTFLEKGFVLCPTDDLSEVIPRVEPVDPAKIAFRWVGDESAELVGDVAGSFVPIVEPAIDTRSTEGAGFRHAAHALGELLVIVGTGLDLDIDAGTFDLASAARNGTLTAGRVALIPS